MVMRKSTSMNLVNVLVRFNQLLYYCCSFPHIQYGYPPSHLPSQRFRKHFFFSFHLRFSPYPVTTTMIWPTSDRIPHSLIFKRMQIKRIADNIRALFFLIDKLQQNRKPDEKKNYCWTKFFHKLDNNKCKCTRAHVQENKSIYLSIYLSIWKPFWKRVYIYIYIYIYTCARVHLHLLLSNLWKNLVQQYFFFRQVLCCNLSIKKNNARILSAILLICILLKIKEWGIRSLAGHIIVVVTG